jgi:rubredoxin-NAD+ reductase
VEALVVVGTGLAGYTLAREWRKLSPEAPLVLVSRDGGELYSKPMLSAALADGRTPASLPTASATDMARQLRAEVRPHTVVQALDLAAREVTVDGTRLAYSRLVLAVGADPIPLSLPGDGAADVIAVNDLDDYTRFRKRLRAGRRIVILGAGLIGCEFASDLAATGYPVAVVDPATWPLSRLLPEVAGSALRDRLAAVGVRWHLGRVAERVERGEHGVRVSVSGGEAEEAELVLSAVGLRPRTALAAAAGLRVNRGIVTGRRLDTSDPGVFALGDCAEVEGLVLPYVMPIMHAARALARTLAGEPTAVTYPAMPVVVKTPAWPTVVSPPPQGANGEWQSEVNGSGVRALFRGEDGRILGFALSGDRTSEKQALARELPPVLA